MTDEVLHRGVIRPGVEGGNEKHRGHDEAGGPEGQAHFFLRGFRYTRLEAFGVAIVFALGDSSGWRAEAEFGAFVGLAVVGARLLDTSVGENRSPRLMGINVGAK